MARNQDATARWDTGTTDTFEVYTQARRARDAFVADLIAKGAKSLYRTFLRPIVGYLAERRVIAEVRSLDPHMLADIGVDRAALATGTLRRRDVIDGLGSGPAMWPRRPESHSVPLSDIIPGAVAANDRNAGNRSQWVA